jgi:hypothetical protein
VAKLTQIRRALSLIRDSQPKVRASIDSQTSNNQVFVGTAIAFLSRTGLVPRRFISSRMSSAVIDRHSWKRKGYLDG